MGVICIQFVLIGYTFSFAGGNSGNGVSLLLKSALSVGILLLGRT
jgi:hypothetical protein